MKKYKSKVNLPYKYITTHKIELDNFSFWLNEYHFKTSSNDSKKPFEFIMYGDQGTYTNAYTVISNIESIIDSIDLILHIGDISYAWGNGCTWEIWSNMVSNIASQVPYMISVGNHE